MLRKTIELVGSKLGSNLDGDGNDIENTRSVKSTFSNVEGEFNSHTHRLIENTGVFGWDSVSFENLENDNYSHYQIMWNAQSESGSPFEFDLFDDSNTEISSVYYKVDGVRTDSTTQLIDTGESVSTVPMTPNSDGHENTPTRMKIDIFPKDGDVFWEYRQPVGENDPDGVGYRSVIGSGKASVKSSIATINFNDANNQGLRGGGENYVMLFNKGLVLSGNESLNDGTTF